MAKLKKKKRQESSLDELSSLIVKNKNKHKKIKDKAERLKNV